MRKPREAPPDPATDYTCLRCGQPVLREGSECYDCGRRRPASLREDTGEAAEPRPGPGRWLGAAAAVTIAALIAAITGFGGPEGTWSATVRGGVVDAVAIPGNCVVAASAHGVVYAFDESTGAERWRFARDDAAALPGLTVDHGRVLFTAADTAVFSIDLRTGATAWRLATNGPCSAPALSSEHVLFALPDRVVALDPDTGREAWRHCLAPAQRARHILVLGRLALIAFGGGDSGGIIALDLQDHEVVWVADLGAEPQLPPRAADSVVLVATRSAKVFGLDCRSGRVLWEHTANAADLATREGTAVVATRDALIAIDALGGRQLWRVARHDHDTAIALRVDGDTLYCTEGSTVRALRLKTGGERWTRAFGETLLPATAVGPGYVYVAPRGGGLVALRTP